MTRLPDALATEIGAPAAPVSETVRVSVPLANPVVSSVPSGAVVSELVGLSETGTGVDVKRTLPVESATVYDAMTWVGSLTAACTWAEIATMAPGWANGGLDATPEAVIDSVRSVSWPGVLRVI